MYVYLHTYMKNKVKNTLIAWLIYTIGTFILLLPFGHDLKMVSISILIGFLFMMFNSIIIQLRMLNGEIFEHLEDNKYTDKNPKGSK